MKRLKQLAKAILLTLLLAACATQDTPDPELLTLDQSRLPPANARLHIKGLGPCTDNPDRTLHINTQQPLTILVHGCFASSGRLRGLAQVLAFHGQQTACFTYNDRDSLKLSASQLNSAIDQLAQRMDKRQLTIIGHSQGALIARKALVTSKEAPALPQDLQMRLVTVSGPFAGIAAASHCGSAITQTLSLGLLGAVCKIITGDKWSEIHHNAEFIQNPGTLNHQVHDYLKIMTDERNSCRRRRPDGTCAESDDIFSLDEQRNEIIDRDAITRNVEIAAGHVEIIGDNRAAPTKLIDLLQRNGIINPTEPQRRMALSMLLMQLYGHAN